MAKLGWRCAALLFAAMSGGAGAAAGAPDTRGARNSVQAVDHASLPGGGTMIRVTFQQELAEPPSVTVHYHPQTSIAFDFANTTSAVSKDPLATGEAGVRSIRVLQTGTRTRLLVDLARPMVQESIRKGKELLITLQPRATMGAGARAPRSLSSTIARPS